MACVMCDTSNLETSYHLFFTCQYANRVWATLTLNTRIQIMIRGDSLEQTWARSEQKTIPLPRGAREKWASYFMAAVWHVWRQRNDKIFRGRAMPPEALALKIMEEAQLWLRYCGGTRAREGIG